MSMTVSHERSDTTAGSRYIRQILSAICYLHAHRWDNQLLEDCQQNCSIKSLSSKTSYWTGVPPRLIWKLGKESPPWLDRTSCVACYWHSLNGWEGSKLLIANASMTGQIDWRLHCLTLSLCVGQRIIYEFVRFISRRSHMAAHDLNYSSRMLVWLAR